METRPDSEAPNSVEAEQQLLGALLLDNALMGRVAGRIEAGDFFDPLHAEIFESVRDRIDHGQLASPVTLGAAMKDHAALKDLGGGSYLAKMAMCAITPGQIAHYAELLVDLSAKRQALEVASEINDMVSQGAKGAAEIAQQAETRLGGIVGRSSVKPITRSHLSALTGALKSVNDAYMGEVPTGTSTGLGGLDNRLAMMRPGNLIVIAGRPAMGKTTVAQSISHHVASGGRGVFFASLEMSAEDLSTRMLAKGLATRGHRIPYTAMLRGNLTEDQMRLVVDETKAQQGLSIRYGERHVRDVSTLRSAARRARQEFERMETPLGLVVIDYIQLVHSSRARSPYERVSEASDMAKSLAMELEVPVIALAQLSRDVERRDDKRPVLSDLRESGKLEEDPDAVIFCYRHAYYLERLIASTEDADELADYQALLARCRHEIELIVAKQRSGATGIERAHCYLDVCHIADEPLAVRGEPEDFS